MCTETTDSQRLHQRSGLQLASRTVITFSIHAFHRETNQHRNRLSTGTENTGFEPFQRLCPTTISVTNVLGFQPSQSLVFSNHFTTHIRAKIGSFLVYLCIYCFC